MKDLISTITKNSEKPVGEIPPDNNNPPENLPADTVEIPPDNIPVAENPPPETNIVTPEDLLAGVAGIGTEPTPETNTEQPKRGRGRPKGSTNKPKADFSDINAATKPPVDYGLMANMTFDMSTGILANVFGPEWLPAPPAKEGLPGERDVVVASLKTYFESKQVQDLPPGLMLTVVLSSYALPRFRQPTTAGKLKLTWVWIKTKVGGFFAKKKKIVISTIPTTTTN